MHLAYQIEVRHYTVKKVVHSKHVFSSRPRPLHLATCRAIDDLLRLFPMLSEVTTELKPKLPLLMGLSDAA